MSPNLDPRVGTFLERASLFVHPWWLDAVAPDRWDVAVAWRGDEVAGVLPYVSRMKLGLRLLEHAPLGFYLGPWLRTSTAREARRIGEEKELMTELMEALPPFAAFEQWFHHRVSNWMPFQWKGYQQTTRYTYLFPDTSDIEKLWAGTRENVRTDIRKARRSLEIVEDGDVSRFLQLQKKTFERQGLALPFDEVTLRRLDDACSARSARCILVAQDASGRPHAAAYLVWDRETAYTLLRASDHEVKDGASAMVTWAAVERASRDGRSFDFVGSWEENIERFVRAFGGQLTPFFEIRKVTSRSLRAYRAIWKLAHGHV